jgi:hypothetical protein
MLGKSVGGSAKRINMDSYKPQIVRKFESCRASVSRSLLYLGELQAMCRQQGVSDQDNKTSCCNLLDRLLTSGGVVAFFPQKFCCTCPLMHGHSNERDLHVRPTMCSCSVGL